MSDRLGKSVYVFLDFRSCHHQKWGDCRSKASWRIKGVLMITMMITKDDDKGDDKKPKCVLKFKYANITKHSYSIHEKPSTKS